MYETLPRSEGCCGPLGDLFIAAPADDSDIEQVFRATPFDIEATLLLPEP
jgi:hypothetical protein